MVTTRRRSGALPNAPPPSRVVDQIEEEMDENPGDDGSSKAQSDDDDAPYGLAPPKKRARRPKKSETPLLQNGNSVKKAQPPKGKGKVRELMKTFFDTLPLDLIFEIFSYLHPSDLLRLSRSGKRIRSLLMSRKSISIWKNARLRLPNVPDCPPDQSEPQWAHLIFENDCTICGTPAIRKVDWHLRIRGCENCLKDHVVYSKTAAKQMPHIEDMQEVLELLPYTHTGGWAHGHSSSSRFYFTGAIEKMAEELDDYKLRVDARVPGAVAELEKFKEIKRKQAEEIVQNGAEVKKWAKVDSVAKANTNRDLRNKRKDAFRAKLVELGHDLRDIENALWSNASVYRAAELTERSWEKARKSLEAAVSGVKIARLAREREAILRPRRATFDRFYSKFCKKIGFAFPGLCPPSRDVHIWPMIAPLIEQDHTPVTEETFEVAEDTLKDRVTSWRKDKLFALLQKMASSGIITINNPPVEDDLQQLELAIANFRCTVGSWRCSSRQYSPTLLRADDSICWHDCIRLRSKWAFECLIFDNDSIEGLNAFMKMLGLDPAVTTASELDALDTRVYCQGCTGEEPTKAYNWRSSVRHLQRHKDCDKPWSGWIKVSDSDAKIIKDGENSGDFSLDGYSPRFICQLCENPRAGECISGIDRERHIQYKHPGHTPAISYYREDPNVAPKPLSVTQVQHVLGYSSVESTAEQSGSGS